MSSGTRSQPTMMKHTANATATRFMNERIARLGMTPRQQMLNKLWSIYCANFYDARSKDWDGSDRVDAMSFDSDALMTANFIPPGFYDSGATSPLKFRRPTAPYPLGRLIVDRFTGLLFSERRHPQIRVQGDADTEDYVNALAEASRIWQSMIETRKIGGAMGTVAVGFQFLDGRPVVEVHDPRWLFPQFEDRSQLKLSVLEKRYMYPVEEQDPESGAWVTVWYWYRRIIDDKADILFAHEPVDEGDEPRWQVAKKVDHGLGFVPVVWVQNIPVLDDIDGEPDAHGTFDMIRAMDALIAQANRANLYQCDPTVVVQTTAALSEIAKGSDNAIKIPDGNATLLEHSGSGPKAALEMVEQLRAFALEVAQCVLDNPQSTGNRTATEVDRRFDSMHAKCDVFREQYGEKCVKPLLEMMVKAARILGEPRVNEDGDMERQSLQLPPRFDKQNGVQRQVDRKLGPGGILQLKWPRYFEPTLQDIAQATDAAVKAKAGGLIDDEHASNFVSEYYDVEDVPAMIEKIESEKRRQQDELEGQMMARMRPPRDSQMDDIGTPEPAGEEPDGTEIDVE